MLFYKQQAYHVDGHHRRLLRGGRLIIMAGTSQMEWNQAHGNHVFDVFDTIPLIPL